MIVQTMPYPAGPAGLDPSIILQVQPSGADGSTMFTDESSYARTLTAEGNAQVDTAVTHFSNPTALFDGTGDFITAASSDDFDLGVSDFTIEMWVKFNAANTFRGLVARRGATPSFAFYVFVGQLYFDFWETGGAQRQLSSSGSSFNTTDFFHIAVTRSSGRFRMFDSGVLRYTSSAIYDATPIRNGGSSVRLGEFNTTTGALQGHMGGFRFTKGAALYTANFTPPTAPFPTA